MRSWSPVQTHQLLETQVKSRICTLRKQIDMAQKAVAKRAANPLAAKEGVKWQDKAGKLTPLGAAFNAAVKRLGGLFATSALVRIFAHQQIFACRLSCVHLTQRTSNAAHLEASGGAS